MMGGRPGEPWFPADPPDSCLLIHMLGSFGIIDDADMGRDDLPSFGKPYPGLHLPTYPARCAVAIEQRRGNRRVPPIGRDHGLVGPPHQPDRRAPGAKRHDRAVAGWTLTNALT